MDYKFTGGGRKKPHRFVKGLIIAAVIAAAIIYAIGILLCSSGGTKQEIAQSIAENRELRNSITEKDSRINELESENKELKAQIENLKSELAAIPTPAPYVPEETAAPEGIQSPRE